MSVDLQELLKLYRQQLENVVGAQIKKIILYGSYARGDFKINSDIDVMILVDTPDTDMRECESKICDVTYDFNCEHDTEIMPVVQEVKHFNYWKKSYMFYRNVDEEGVPI
ncbi:MAG: nucleotidyltransferase domain-containing protein [Lachnospiraceae bacterium]|nr:nucleotidyltransferase domain-containing protein [Lachnospiraceae bacterium]